MKFILRGSRLLELSGMQNAHQLALRSQVSYPTIDKYVNRPELVGSFDTTVLAEILSRGLGMTPEQISNITLGDLFELAE